MSSTQSKNQQIRMSQPKANLNAKLQELNHRPYIYSEKIFKLII